MGISFLSRMATKLILFISIMMCSLSVQAMRSSSYEALFYLSSGMTIFKDLQLSSEDSLKLTNTIDAEAAVRLFGSFQLIAAASQTTDDTRSAFGGGIRIDLPGFFYIGGRVGRVRRAKNHPVNTSAFMKSMLTKQKSSDGKVQRSVATHYGLSMEFFLFSETLYLHLNGGLYNLEGNSFATYGGGLGIEF